MRLHPLILAALVAIACYGKDSPQQQPDASPDTVAPFDRDWARHPAIVQMDTEADVYALGDVHGDYDRMESLLANAAIIVPPGKSAPVRWLAGKAVLVCTGDLIDKWKESLRVLLFFQDLARAAEAAGGRVIVTMGNHEARFLADPTNEDAIEFAEDLRVAGISPLDVAAGRHAVGVYLRSLPFAARVNDWFFSHAGNTAGRSLAAIESDIVSDLRLNGFAAPQLQAHDSLLQARLAEPWWEAEGTPEATLDRYVAALGVEHLALGHEPGIVAFSDGAIRQPGEIFQKFGRVFLIDSGLSRGVAASASAMLLVRRSGLAAEATVILQDGSRQPLWPK